MRIGIQVVCAFFRYEATKECRQMDSRLRGNDSWRGNDKGSRQMDSRFRGNNCDKSQDIKTSKYLSDRIIAFSMTNNLRIQAVSATFFSFPFSNK